MDLSIAEKWAPLAFAPILSAIVAYLTVRATNKRHKIDWQNNYEILKKQLFDNEKQRQMEVGKIILEKQLNALQGVYEKLRKLNIIVNGDTHKTQDMKSTVEEIRNFHDENSIYMPKALQDTFLGLINRTSKNIKSPNIEYEKDIKGAFNKIQEYVDKLMAKYSLIES
ncbi:MAG: hypothetical protein ABIE07_05350 [Candidatus Zixiibacteriota bacterium]